ncbi:50S ribosomal protein L14 [Candidatus Dependentiae bacterium]|nr:50S ribosomal protein L14 [Candidatus Dependentiae bacterium]
MLQKESYLEVADNSGAQLLQIIHVVGGTRKRFAYTADLVRCAVKKAIPGGTVKKGDVVTAVIVRTRKEYRRADGSYIRFGDNAGVLIKSVEDFNTLVGTRIFGPVARELRAKEFTKLVSLAPEVL